jgi:ubiquinone/menaquinone biosynthesis C-methylase UbiE
MVLPEMHEDRSSADRSRVHHLVPIAGITVAVIVALAHLAGGAAFAHATIIGNLGGGALVIGLLAIAGVKIVLLLVARATRRSAPHAAITSGRTIHGARSYDLFVALLTLGRAGTLRDRTIALARIVPGEDVLDVGCGTGEIAMRARARTGPTGSVAGIDPAPEMIAVACEKAARAGVEIDYRVAAVEALPFAAASFDVVVSSLMMHHLPEDLKPRALAEIRRVLKPSGRFVIVDFQQPASRLGRLAPVWLLHRWENIAGLRELPALLRVAGFTAAESRATGIGYLGCVVASTSEGDLVLQRHFPR